MAKQLNQLEVNLSFGADTKEAKKAIMELQKSLQAVAKLPGQSSSLFDDVGINKASKAARELEQHLSKAVNVDTGKLDLSRFSSSLKASNKTLTEYCNTLLSTGEVGQKAFLQLAQSIAAADTPTTRINKKLQEMGTTLKNTARWQISSSILHGFMGALQSAYGYAQDLNASLNDIRIVTGYNAEQMEKFAEKANKAAKALSATTTEYTNASLIYFQQGLNDAQVAERTEVTIKMANAAGVSAEKASDQLTAVWNNFYDGSKSLEYYADVMTALGAATASSTDEISEGLNKFAAVAETVGLSYEYAASALATVTATTRQSADVVGTAFKTLFARLQDLELGETLDDGTTLGKYSAALNSVGINIKDTNGEMKEMDQILDELGAKWQNLSKDTQAALAQTVAGTRQYTQLIALMDNWDYFQANLGVAKDSSGTLQEQADIYAESWEAAQDRVRAAAENIYQSLLDDDFFIDLLNGLEKVLGAVGGLIDGFGGMKGVIMTISSVFMTSFAQKMPTVIENLKQNFMVFTGQAEKEMVKTQNELQLVLQAQGANSTNDSYKVQVEGISKVTEMKKKLIAASKSLTQQEREEYEAKIKAVEGMYAEIDALVKKKEAAEAAQKVNTQNIKKDASKNATDYFENLASSEAKVTDLQDKATAKGVSNEAFAAYLPMIAEAEEKAKELNLTINNLNTAIEETGQVAKLTDTEMDALMNDSSSENGVIAQKKIQDALATTIKKYQDTTKARVNLDSLSSSVKTQAEQWQKVAKSVEQAKVDKNSKAAAKAVDITKQKMQSYLKTLEKIAADNKIAFNKRLVEELNKEIESLSTGNITKATNLFAQLAQEVETVVSPKITELDADIDKLETNLGYLGTSKNGIATLGKDAMETAVAGQQLSDSLSNIGGIADENIKSFTSTSVALTEFASVAMSVSGLINTVKSSLSIIFDEGTSGVEKFGAAVSILSGVMAAYNAVMAFGTTLKKIDTSAETTNMLAKMANAASSKVAATLGVALGVAKTTETGAVWANTAAWYANPIMWIALVIMAAVAAVALLITAIVKLSTAESDEAKAAQRAAEAYEAMGEQADAAKNKVEELKSAFDGYDDVVAKLNECIKGTEEWYKALDEVNDYVLQLMQDFPELAKIAGLFYRDLETGSLMINEDVRDQIMNKATSASSVASSAELMSGAYVAKTKLDVEESQWWDTAYEVYRKRTSYADVINDDGTMGTEAYLEATGETAAINLSKILHDQADKLANLNEEQYREAVKELIENNNPNDIKAWENYDEVVNQLVDSSLEYRDKINSLAEATEQASVQMENAANAVAEMALGDKYGGAEKEAASEAYEKKFAKEKQAIYDELTAKDRNHNRVADDLVKEYGQALGLELKATDNAIQGSREKRVIEYKNTATGEITTVTAEQMAQTIAASRAMKDLGATAEACAKALDTLKVNASAETAQAIEGFIATGNMDHLSQDDRDRLQKEMGDISSMSGTDISSYLQNTMGLSEADVFTYFGVADANELEKKWKKAWSANETALASAGEFLTKSVEESFNALDTTSLTAEQKKALSNYMNTALIESGDVSIFTDAYNKVAKDQKDEFLKAFDGVDWTTVSVDEFREKLKQAGVTASFSNSELEQLIDSMGTAAEKSLDYAEVMKIIGDIKIGDTISAEEYSKLGDGYEEYFRLMADGTYQLTSDAEEFYNLVKENALQQFINKINNASNSNKNINNVVGKFNTDYSKEALTKNTYHIGYGDNYSDAFDKNAAQNQLEFLTATGAIDNTTLSTWQAIINDRNSGINVALDETLKSTLEEMNAAVAQNQHFWEDWQNTVDDNNKIIEQNIIQYLSSAESLNEFDELLLKLKEETGLNSISTQIYSDALKMLGSQYENCAEEIKAYEEALLSGNIDEIDKAEGMLKLAISVGEVASKYGLSAKEIEAQAAMLQQSYKISEEASIQLAIQNQRMNEGLETLVDKWETWNEALISNEKTSSEYAATLVEIQDVIRQLTGVSEDCEISFDFINKTFADGKTTLDLLAEAATGSAKAINRLGIELAKDMISNFDMPSQEYIMNNNVGGARDERDLINNRPMSRNGIRAVEMYEASGEYEAEIAKQAWDEVVSTVTNGLDALQAELDAGLEIGSPIESLNDEWVAAMNEMAKATGMSVDEMNSYLASLGVDAKVTTDTINTRQWMPKYKTTVTRTKDGGYEMDTVPNGGEWNDVPQEVAAINGEVKYIGNGSINPGNSSKAASQKAPKKMEKIDPYAEINESLEETVDALDKASKKADRLYGNARLKEMQKVNKELLNEISLLEEKQELAEGELKTLTQTLVGDDGVSGLMADVNELFGTEMELTFDADGSITNYTEIMNSLIALYNEKLDELTDAQLEELKTMIDTFQSTIDKYNSTKSLIRDIKNQKQEAHYKWQDNNYEQLTYALEVELEINDDAMQDLEYRLNKLGDDVYSMAEAIGLMVNGFSKEGQLGIYLDNLSEYESHMSALQSDYAAGRISQADYVDGLRQVQDGIYENLEAINELDKAMMEYYGETLAAARDEIDKYIESMTHQTTVLEHYVSLMGIMGKSTDYKTMGKILEAQSKTLENQAKVAKKTMDMMQAQAEERRVAYEEALASGNEAMIELYKKQYEEALLAAQEAQDNYLSSAEEWAESLKSILENKLSDLGQSLEDALTGGTSFDQLSTSMERAASLQEEYLTSTNKIYETTKMMRTAQQEIDKTTNSVAKQKLAGFIQETKQMQNQSKLSKYELDIQQAKYDLLLAELALEESKNAKSTVRLQRDAEGNFGYVYTADNNAIAEATQKYEDAQNALYNIGLEGTTDYAQKYQQTLNEMYDTITDLQNQYLDGAFSSEKEYNEAVQAAKEHYYAKLQEYSTLYGIATKADNRVIADSWTSTFTTMIGSTEEWKDAVDDYTKQATSAFGEWKTAVDGIATETGTSLGNLNTNLLNLTNQSDALATAMTEEGGVIDSLDTVLDTVVESTDEYADLRAEIEVMAEKYRELAEAASQAAAAQALVTDQSMQPEAEVEPVIDYAELLETTMAEMYEELAAIEEKHYKAGTTDTLAYQVEMEEAKSKYYEKLKAYSTEYREALDADNTLVAEDWFLTLEKMIQDQSQWEVEVNKYIDSVKANLTAMNEGAKTVAEETGGELEKLATSVGGVTEKIEALTKAIMDEGKLKSALEIQISLIRDSLLDAYDDLDGKLTTVTSSYENLATAARNAAAAMNLKVLKTQKPNNTNPGFYEVQYTDSPDSVIPVSCDTGGYTGTWGSYGKLAVLHEKELILNKDDTENFLTGMGLLDNILKMIDLQSASAQIGGLLTSPGIAGNSAGMLEQSVHIEASFPNVQDRNEIEDAFNNLINRASQYANRKV